MGCSPLAALACALDHIPYVGIEVSAAVLLLCVTRLIGARTFTDAIFTTGIAYALTFCFNLFVLSAMLGDLRHTTSVRARTAEPSDAVQATEAGTPHGQSGVTNLPAQVVSNSTASPAPATNVSREPATPRVTPPTPAVAAASPISGNAGRLASDVSQHFSVKGISRGAVETIAVIGSGAHTYDVAAGDTFQIQTSTGKANAVCKSVDDDNVVLEVEGVTVTLRHR